MGSPSGVRKRRRPAYSCIECRRRKVRCDRATPCGQCTAHNAPSCTYAERYPRASQHTESPTKESRQQQKAPEQAVQPHSAEPRTSGAPTRIRGALNKTRVFGYGHWMNAESMIDGLPALEPVLKCYQSIFHGNTQDMAAQTVTECKQLARDAKRQRPSRKCLPPDIFRSFPDVAVMDDLVRLYFATFESCYRILHYPSFIEEYHRSKNDLKHANSSFIVELILIMSATGVMHADANIRDDITAKSRDWIQIAQTWLSAPLEKDRLTWKGIQIHCLLLLARQVTRLGADLVWISAGSLMRMAMQMGLHMDPNHMAQMSLQEKEIRRRLWYTILEMNVQAALDSGMSPMINTGDFNTLPPSRMSDEDIKGSSAQGELQCETHGVSYQKPLLPLLADSLPLRLNVTKVLNSLQVEPSYDEVLRLDKDLTAACRTATTALEHTQSATSKSHTSQFAISHFTHLLRRFTLCLHFPYALQATQNPIYTYSQKLCFDAALDIVSLLDDKLYTCLLLTGGGMFRDLITRGAFIIYLELTSDMDADASLLSRIRKRARQEPVLRDAQRVAQYAKERMRHGETNVKGYVFIRMATAQIEALFDGSPQEEATMNAARESLETCRQILSDMAAKATGVGIEPGISNGVPTPLESLDGQFDFLDDGSLDFDLGESILFQQWGESVSL
ncbi:hypothetical protein BDV59DRAFT_163801 [Aspergillus ambiguus]|uniref:putative C6 transcription factor n=1 Tax=Aspergillus ambiguus TaxID=176160 RepID=UPI003CCDFBF0